MPEECSKTEEYVNYFANYDENYSKINGIIRAKGICKLIDTSII